MSCTLAVAVGVKVLLSMPARVIALPFVLRAIMARSLASELDMVRVAAAVKSIIWRAASDISRVKSAALDP